MPDVEVNIGGDDDLTPKLDQIKQSIQQLAAAAAQVAEKLSEAFAGAEIDTFTSDVNSATEAVNRLHDAQKSAGGESGAGLGGFVKHGMFAQAMSGLKEGGLGGALEGLTKGMGSTLMMVMEWTWAWKLAEIPLNAIVGAITEVGTVIAGLGQEMHASGESVTEMVGDLNNLAEASARSSTSVSQLMSTRQKLMGVGFTKPEATREAEHIGSVMADTGADITNLVEKARYFKASAEDILSVSQKAGGAFGKLTAPAEAYLTQESTKGIRRLQLQEQETADQRAFQDQTHYAERLQQLHKVNLQIEMEDRQKAASRYMEDMHRAATYELEDKERITQYALEDNRRAVEQEMQDRFREINREMEMRHLMVNREIEDRHRAAEYETEDFNRIHGRQMSAITGMAGAAESALFGQPMQGALPVGTKGKTIPVYFSLPPDARRKILGELNEGFQQFQKDTGIDRGTAEQMMRAGVISSGTIMQEAAAARQEQQELARRARNQESIKENRDQQDESIKKRIDQEDELIKKTRELSTNEREANREMVKERTELVRQQTAEETELHRNQADEQLNTSRVVAQDDRALAESVYQDRVAMERKYQDARLEMEKDTVIGLLKLNIGLQAAIAESAQDSAKGVRGWNYLNLGRFAPGASDFLASQQGDIKLTPEQQKLKDIYDNYAATMADAVNTAKDQNAATAKTTDALNSNLPQIGWGTGAQAVGGAGGNKLAIPDGINVKDELVASKIDTLNSNLKQLLTIG